MRNRKIINGRIGKQSVGPRTPRPEILDDLPPSRQMGSEAIRSALATTADLDGRTKAARRLRDLRAALWREVKGRKGTSETRTSVLIEQLVNLVVQTENEYARFLLGQPAASLETQSRAANTIRRIVEDLGLDRLPPGASTGASTLDEYLAANYGVGADADDDEHDLDDDEPAPKPRRRVRLANGDDT